MALDMEEEEENGERVTIDAAETRALFNPSSAAYIEDPDIHKCTLSFWYQNYAPHILAKYTL